MKSGWSDSQVLGWQIQGNASLDVVAILQVTVETDSEVKDSDDGHACVQDAVPATKIGGRAHVLLQR